VSTITTSVDEEYCRKFAEIVGIHHYLISALIYSSHQNSSAMATILARAAILRACISVFDKESLLWPNDFEKNKKKELLYGIYESPLIENLENVKNSIVSPGLLLGCIFSQVLCVLQSTDPLLQVYGLQTLETWLGRVDIEGLGKYNKESQHSILLCNENNELSRILLFNKLYSISELLCRSWSHPHKSISK
jgi:hypothetical protein